VEEGSIPDGERLGRAYGGAAELEDEVGCFLGGGIQAGAAGMAGTSPADCSAPPELEDEEERGFGIGMRRWGEDKVTLVVGEDRWSGRWRVASMVLRWRGQRWWCDAATAGRGERGEEREK